MPIASACNGNHWIKSKTPPSKVLPDIDRKQKILACSVYSEACLDIEQGLLREVSHGFKNSAAFRIRSFGAYRDACTS